MQLTARRSIERAAWERVNFPLFVPPAGADLLAVLAKLGAAQFIADLDSRANLGVTWASAILGFLELKGAISGQVRLDRAKERCLPAARAGDSYAQYVLAWSLLELKQPEEAFRWMNLAASEGNFLPAWADLGRFALGGVGLRHSDVARGVSLLWSAHRRGHRAPLLFICDTYRRGKCGRIRRLLAYFMLPYAIALYYVAVRREPFAQRVFVNPQLYDRPFFSAVPGNARTPSRT